MRSLIYVLILFSGIICLILAIRAQKQGRIQVTGCGKGKKVDIFEVMAWYLYKTVCIRRLIGARKNTFWEFLFQAPCVKRDLRALKPEVRPELSQAQYYVLKLKRFLLFFYVGDLLALCIHVSSLGGGMLYEGRYIDRNSYGGGAKTACVQWETKEGNYGKEIQVIVEELPYTEEELETLFTQAVSRLEEVLLKENTGLDEVRSDLTLPDCLEGYPFLLKWESSDYFLMDHKGVVQKEEVAEEGEELTLTCRFAYREWEREMQLPIVVYPPYRTKEELWEKQAEQALAQAEEEQLYEKTFALPETIGGRLVTWKEITEDYSIFLMGIMVLAACGVYLVQDHDLHKKAEERNQQMLAEYPVLINRLTLYLGAGMTIKNAWHKIAMDYRNRQKESSHRNYAYEEMLFSCYEMQGGVAEGSAYERFGQRCGLQPYTRLIGLLNQSLKKGNAALLRDLQKEAEDAQEARRNLARKKGEEAGTKLLLPMMMMLGIVMVLVMVPAFFSFSM